MTRSFANRSFYSACSGIAVVLASFASGVIVANLLGVEGAGVVAFAVWVALVVAPVVDGGTALTIGRFLADLKGRNEAVAAHALSGRLARRLLLFNLLAAGAVALFYAIDPDAAIDAARRIFATMDAGSSVRMTLLVALLVVLQSFATFGIAYFRGSQSFLTLAGLNFAAMVAQIVCVYVGALLYGAPGSVAGYAIGQAGQALWTARLLLRRGKIEPALVLEIRRYGRFSWAANVCNAFVWSRMEILFLQGFWGYREVGLFSVALTLAALASQGPLLLTGAFLPMFANKHGQDDRQGLQEAFARGTHLLAMLAFPACFGMAAILPGVVSLLYGAEFLPAIPAAMIIVAAAALSVTTVVGTHLVNALARSDFIFFSSLLGAGLSLAAGFLLIPSFGLLGAAVSRAAIQIAMIGFGLWFITRRLGFSYPFGSLLRILVAALLASLAAFLVISAIGGVRGLLAAVVVSAVIYAFGLRLSGAVDPADVALARRVSAALPSPLAAMARALVSLIGPARTAGPATSANMR